MTQFLTWKKLSYIQVVNRQNIPPQVITTETQFQRITLQAKLKWKQQCSQTLTKTVIVLSVVV